MDRGAPSSGVSHRGPTLSGLGSFSEKTEEPGATWEPGQELWLRPSGSLSLAPSGCRSERGPVTLPHSTHLGRGGAS